MAVKDHRPPRSHSSAATEGACVGNVIFRDNDSARDPGGAVGGAHLTVVQDPA